MIRNCQIENTRATSSRLQKIGRVVVATEDARTNKESDKSNGPYCQASFLDDS